MSEESKISKAQQRAVHKYVKNNYDRLEITVPKGKKAVIKAHAEQQAESMNQFIVRAINETMERDGGSILAESPKVQPAVPESAAPAQQEPESRKREAAAGNGKKYKPFTEADARRIDYRELLSNVRYQLDIGLAFGDDVLRVLMDKAYQQQEEQAKKEAEPGAVPTE